MQAFVALTGGFRQCPLKMQIDFPDFSIRSWRGEDLESLLKHANNRRVSADLRDRFPYPYTREVGESWLTKNVNRQPETNFAIAVEDHAVGGIGLELKTDVERCTAELGYWLGEEYWGRGIASRAARAVTEIGFQEFGLSRVFAIVFIRNTASCRVLEKAGFIRECMMPRSGIKNGEILDQYMYAAVDAIWRARQESNLQPSA
jgi:ribosomal-protein-alanine N-acetyltransferase